jgi:hypothetical protein
MSPPPPPQRIAFFSMRCFVCRPVTPAIIAYVLAHSVARRLQEESVDRGNEGSSRVEMIMSSTNTDLNHGNQGHG